MLAVVPALVPAYDSEGEVRTAAAVNEFGKHAVTLRNGGAVPMSAYLIVYRSVDKRGRVSEGFDVYDSVLASPLAPAGQPLLPGQERTISGVGSGVEAHLGAAVFNDGTVIGERAWIDHLIGRRRVIYKEVLPAIKTLSAAQQGSFTTEQILAEFEDRGSLSKNPATTPAPDQEPARQFVPEVVKSILTTSKYEHLTQPVPVSRTVEIALRELRALAQRLEGSLPHFDK